MPFTELVTPSLKQDDVTRDMFINHKSALFAPIISARPPGEIFSGSMTIENGINVKSELKLVLGLEWESQEDFVEFVTSEKFKAFVGTIKSFVLAPPQPQLYRTNVSPKVVLSAPVTEAFRIIKHENSDEIENAWKDFASALSNTAGGIEHLSGWSVNLESEIFTGVLGWKSLDVRECTLKDPNVIRTRENLGKMPESTFFVAEFSPLN